MSSKARRLVQPCAVALFDLADADLLQTVADGADGSAPPRDEDTPAAAASLDEQRQAEIEHAAFAKGFASGERAGAEAARQRGDALVRQLTVSLESLAAVRADMIRRTERQMVELALTIARRIVHREVAIDADLLMAMARVALDRLGESTRVTIRLHPDELSAMAAARDRHAGATHVQVIADPRMARGGCQVDTDLGSIDAGVDAQIQEVARALLGHDYPMETHADHHG
jgi:flagellar assembly protein FliH